MTISSSEVTVTVRCSLPMSLRVDAHLYLSIYSRSSVHAKWIAAQTFDSPFSLGDPPTAKNYQLGKNNDLQHKPRNIVKSLHVQ